MQKRKIRMGMVGGGQGAFIGGVHRIAAAIDQQIELVCGAQAREFTKDLRAGRGAEAAHAELRKVVEPLEGDRYLEPDLRAAKECIASGRLVAAVEAAVGPLLP